MQLFSPVQFGSTLERLSA